MVFSKFNEITSLSNQQISEKISEIEIEIFNIQFQKATKQNFNIKKLKQKTRLFAQLKTLLKQRVKETKIKQENIHI